MPWTTLLFVGIEALTLERAPHFYRRRHRNPHNELTVEVSLTRLRNLGAPSHGFFYN